MVNMKQHLEEGGYFYLIEVILNWNVTSHDMISAVSISVF